MPPKSFHGRIRDNLPVIKARVHIPELKAHGTFDFVISTGSPQTILSPAEAAKAGVIDQDLRPLWNTTVTDHLDRAFPAAEDQFLAKYLSWLATAGYDLPFHVIDSKNHAKVTSTGFPDTFASHQDPWRGILAAELKSETGQATAEQWTWLTRLARQLPPPPDGTAKSRAHLWQPRDEPKILTQMGIPKGAPQNCDCPVCLHMAGEDPFPPERRSLKPPPPKPKCPICGRDTTNRRLESDGNCGRCRRADVRRYEETLIAERTIDPLSQSTGRIAPP